ncbi:transglutaminase domain-containing protein [Conexibacter arvalis]|uniref:Transglutaminase-like putative cysteine protease n=1 Tax=Conexibacter arvalis TaxID=912552 RepID=A0A840IEH2_9ACTN|nr:transglutaminase domain-containing protein [Conexibacter arvalis]MBB4663397.1 transglutaminase-like putative cysteine protease [Conexibacter arvalis]
MSATAPPAPSPPATPPTPAPPPPHGDGRRALPLLSPPLARVLTLAALGSWAAIRWGTLVEPGGAGRMLLLLVLALATGLAVAQLSLLPPLLQAPAAVAVVVGWAATSVLAAGAPASGVLDPAHWDDLAAGLQQGIDALPQVLVPYSRAAIWPRIAILLGGALLLALGCVLALSPGRHGTPFRGRAPFGGGLRLRLAAAVPLTTAAVLPTAIMEPAAPVEEGLLLFALLAGFLWLERLPRVQLPGALALVVVAALAGALATGPLDRDEPWVDVQALVEGLDRPQPARFDWSQRYGPLDWPRDGREVLRVRSSERSYWKARNLDGFDGIRWTSLPLPAPAEPDAELPSEVLRQRDWQHSIAVEIGDFATSEVVAAGTTLRFPGAPVNFQAGSSPGTWIANEPLERGDAYTAEVVVPRPRRGELRAAGADYPQAIADRYLTVGLPRREPSGARRLRPGTSAVRVAPFGSSSPPAVRQQLRLSPYAGVDVLARQLGDGAASPYELVQRVLAHLRSDAFTYSEEPPRRQLPLEAFLFRDRLGYCQQFAGAAALLLRLGGVPARVAAGFTGGTPEQRGRATEYVVRDYDAHAWIEVWFPRVGWIEFDPTPTTAPARSRSTSVTGTALPPQRAPARRELPAQPEGGAQTPAAGAAADDGGSFPVGLAAVLGALALAVGLALARLLRPLHGTDALLAELERALRRTGRPPEPHVTLLQLERRLHDAPDAAAYVRAIRLARFGDGEAVVTARQRRALRAELARNLGAAGRLRALLALPPRRGG